MKDKQEWLDRTFRKYWWDDSVIVEEESGREIIPVTLEFDDEYKKKRK